MLADSVLELRTVLHGQNILFTYSGHVSETLLFSLGETVKRQLDLNHTDRTVRKKVFSVFVVSWNVIRYSSEVMGIRKGVQPVLRRHCSLATERPVPRHLRQRGRFG